ncbi:Peptidase aspartic protein [Rutstroemia sp. NJR-2017a BBW]|nr:Peptidase aspartic protein [Rutstroemia sp. NJR-2017a BBW]
MSVARRLLSSCILLTFPLIITSASASSDCAPPPIPIRIGNVTLSNGHTARGLDISVGTPPQSFAFLPQWPLNNSFLYGTNGLCNSSWASDVCTTFRGGQYDEFASKTRASPGTDSYPSDGSPYPSMKFVTDNYILNSNITKKDYPIGIARADWGEQGYYPQTAMGLGSNSTILNALSASGQIASRTWSMFWGRVGATSATQMDGSFVFGGYDRAKVSGQNHTQSLSTSKQSCPTGMLVTITDMTLNFSNGTDISLFDGAESTAISACLVPSYPVLMTIPLKPYFGNFESDTNQSMSLRTFGLYYYGLLYDGNMPGSGPYTGDLTIELDSGFSARIPNDQLVVPNLTIDEETGALIADGSTPELVLNAIQEINANDLPQLGRQFLTAAYLMLNQEAQEFTLWQANPTENEDLVAVDSQNNAIQRFCSPPSQVSNDSSSTNNLGPASSNSKSTSSTNSAPGTQAKRISTGALAGIAVGCIAALGILVGIFFWICVRRIKSKRQFRTRISTQASTSFLAGQIYPDPLKVPHFIPQELHAIPVKSFSMLHQELP